MILAELELFHSRPIAPTRRVAIGRTHLPADPPPGYGGLLLGGVVANNIGALDPDLIPDLHKLMNQLDQDMRIPQPRLRHRLQEDRVGLQRSLHKLVGQGESVSFEFDDRQGDPAQQLLGAVYAAGRMPPGPRRSVMATLRRAMSWTGPIGPDLVASLAGFERGRSVSTRVFDDPVGWALDTLGFINGARRGTGGVGPDRKQIQQHYRRSLMGAHPDHGAGRVDAAQRIADITEARRILLG